MTTKMIIIYLASWGLAIYLCHSLAKKKGFDTTSAVVWAVLFGWFAVIVYALRGPKANSNPANQTNP